MQAACESLAPHGSWTTLRAHTGQGLLHLLIDKPPLSLLTQTVRQELGSLFLALGNDSAVRCVLWHSGEHAFCAGADLKEFPQRFTRSVARVHGENAHRMILALLELDTPSSSRCAVPAWEED